MNASARSTLSHGFTCLALAIASLSLTHPAAASSTKPSNAATAVKLGTVQSVQAVQVKGEGSGAGVVAGAVLGGLVGNQMGKGTGNALLTVGGAVAGGYAGNEVEKNVKKHTVYKTRVKLDDGTVQEFSVGQQYAIGARVQITGKKLTLAP